MSLLFRSIVQLVEYWFPKLTVGDSNSSVSTNKLILKIKKIMETFTTIFSYTLLYLFIGFVIWSLMVGKKYNIESIHIFTFLLFWPIILLVVLYKYIIFSIKELFKLLKKLYNYEYDSKNK